MKKWYNSNSEDLQHLLGVLISNFGKAIECPDTKGKYRLSDLASNKVTSIPESRLKYLLECLHNKLGNWGYFSVLMELSDSSEVSNLALSVLSHEDRSFIMNIFRRFALKLNYSDMIISDSVNGLRRNTLWLKLCEIT